MGRKAKVVVWGQDDAQPYLMSKDKEAPVYTVTPYLPPVAVLSRGMAAAKRMRDTIQIQREEGIRLMIRALGDDPNREGLRDTPRRVVKAWQELTSGYGGNPQDLVTTFDSEGYDEMVMVGPVTFFSICEHHLLPFFGEAWVAYVPGKSRRIIGLSKLPRLVELYARRLQNQERMTSQIVDTLTKLIKPKGAACLVKSTHLCASMRGVRQPNAKGVTCRLKGVFFNQPATRAEFMALVEMNNG